MKFEELNIAAPILRALANENYAEPTPIQEQAIPPVLAGRDLLGCAQTGTGKTAAFAVPILQLLSRKKEPHQVRALILTPTRELAMQIFDSFRAYGRFTDLRACVVFGGVSQVPQVEKLKRGVDILIATPGRLNDLLNQGCVDLQHVQIFVLDEADRMLDMGFIIDVKKIAARIPQKKQTLLFSATMPKEIADMVDTILDNPVKVTVTPPATTVEAIEQSVYFVDKENKRKLLIHLLKNPDIRSALVFTRTKHGADRVVRELLAAKINALAIHGDKSQNARQMALNSFKQGVTRVLVATDIAARGIDIEELSHVINYDLPNMPETYVHRIGRTGRAGASGIAISFCDIEEKPYLKDIEKLIGKQVPVILDHPYPMVVTVAPPKKPQQRRPARCVPAAKAGQREKPMKKAVEIKESNEIKQHSRPKLEPQKSGHEASQNHKPEAGRHGNAAHQERQTGQNHQGRHNQHAQGHQTPQRLSSQKIVTVKDAFEQEPAHKPANAPKPFIQHSEHRQKPVDQFLENKPFIRKG